MRKLNVLRGGFADAFKPGRDGGKRDAGKQDSKAAGSSTGGGDASAFERAVRQRAVDEADALRARARKEIGALPFTSCVAPWQTSSGLGLPLGVPSPGARA